MNILDKNQLSGLRQNLKIIIPLWITFFILIFLFFTFFIPSLKQHMLNQKKAELKNLTEITCSLLSEYNQRIIQGELSPESARSKAKTRIKNLRYGKDRKDYFWINNMHPRMIMHPYMPELNNMDLTDYTTADGKHFFLEVVKTLKHNKSAYFDYMWQWNDNIEITAPKLSHVKLFEPWEWVIGTGIYLNDVYAEIDLVLWKSFKIFTGLLVIMILISLYSTLQTLKIEKKRNRAEKALLESERRFRNLSDLTFEGILFHKNGIAIDINKSFIKMFGYQKEEILGRNLIDMVIPEKYHSQIRKNLKKEIALPYETTAVKKDGTLFPVEIESRDIKDENSHYRVTAVRDISKRKQSEEAIQKSEKIYRAIFENTGNATIIIEQNMTISLVNTKFADLSGYSRQEIEGKKLWTEFVADEDINFMKNLHASRREKNNSVLKEYEFKFINKNREVRQILLYIGLIPETKQSVASLLDITNRKEMETELRQAHKMESIGTLAGGIAHDLNNILFPVIGYTEILQHDISENSPYYESLEKIRISAMRAKELVKQILTFSRPDIQEMKLVNIEPVVREAVELMKSTIPKTIKIKTDIVNEGRMIKANPTQIHQIVMNLATNAYHAMEKTGGELTISLKKTSIDTNQDIQPSEIIPGRYSCLSISDTGPGMDKDLSEKIFDPFFTTKKTGTGMGLSVVHGIVKSMNGFIRVKSEPDKGSEFCIYFPLAEKVSAEQVPDNLAPVLTGKGYIMIVDDEKEVLLMEKKVLEHFGYRVSSHTGSVDALRKFRDESDSFDIVVTDMTMPDMPGDIFAEELRKIRPDIPIILLTGYSDSMSEEKALAMGINAFFIKPVPVKDLTGKISEILSK